MNDNNFKEDMKQFRIEQLKKLIPELTAIRERKAGRRLFLVFIGMYIITAILFWQINKDKTGDIALFFLMPLIISIVLIIISYIVCSLSFGKNQHEAMIIEKLKTELYVLADSPEDSYDMLLEISKIRSYYKK
jgi:hypothetical protein